jgi:hypothetical protein
MVFTPDVASLSDLDIFLDLDNPTYGFATDLWVEAPAFCHPKPMTTLKDSIVVRHTPLPLNNLEPKLLGLGILF